MEAQGSTASLAEVSNVVSDKPLSETSANGPVEADETANDEVISKAEARRRRKALMKQQRIEYGRQKVKTKKREQKQRKRAARREFLATMTEEERAAYLKKEEAEKQEGNESLQRAFDSGAPKIVINCSYSSTLSNQELSSLAKQAQMAYTAVRDMRSSAQLHLASLSADNVAMQSFEAIGFRKWLIHVHAESCWTVFDPARLIILSPDADEDLEDVEGDLVYVIGGIVDRTVRKGQSRSQAEEHGARCLRRLPIKKYGAPGMHPVLNIDTVVRLLAERFRGEEWSSIFEACLPSRHQKLKRPACGEDEDSVVREKVLRPDECQSEAASNESSGDSEDVDVGSEGCRVFEI